MIRYGSVDETVPQPRTERTRPLLPRPRTAAEETRPPAAWSQGSDVA